MKNDIFLSIKLFLILFILFVFLGCPTKPDDPTGSISGSVYLDNESNHSGITISVYNLAELDTKIVDINTEYPHIGVIINQQTQFDHRFQTAIKTSITNEDGDFEVKNIPVGVYNIVISKDNYGFKYIYNVSILDGSNQLDTVFSLYQETHLSGDSFDDLTFQKDHHYIIDDDYNIYNADVVIEPSSVIRIEPGKSINISLCEVLAQGKQDSLFWITSNDGFDQSSTRKVKDEIDYFQSVILITGTTVLDNIIKWGKIDFNDNCLSSSVNNLFVKHCIFRESFKCFSSQNVSNTFCENLLCYNNDVEENSGIYFYQVDDGLINQNIFLNNYTGVQIQQRFVGEITNNAFKDNYSGLDLLHFVGIIQNNDFSNTEYDIYYAGDYFAVDATDFMEIYYNIFQAKHALHQHSVSQYNHFSSININNNNFINNNLFILYHSTSYEDNINAVNNYFDGLSSEDSILERIVDYIGENSIEVLVIPFENHPITNAGIQ